MFILSSICSSLEFWSVNHISIYENSELKVFKNMKFLGEISRNWPNNLLGTNIYIRLLNIADNRCWKYYNGLILLC